MLKKLNSPFILGLLSNTSFGATQFLLIALYPALSSASKIEISDLIISFGIGPLLFIWSAPFWAIQSERVGRQKILRIGLTGLTLSFVSIAMLTSYHPSQDLSRIILIGGRVIYGITASAIPSVVQAWLRDQELKPARSMVYHSIGINLGRLIAPLLVLILDGSLPLLIGATSIWLITITGASYFIPSTPIERRNNPIGNENYFFQPLIMAFFTTFIAGLTHSSLANFVKNKLNLSMALTTVETSKLLLASGSCMLIVQILLAFKKDIEPKKIIKIGLACILASAIFFVKAQRRHEIWIAVLLLTIGISHITPGYLALMRKGGKTAGLTNSIHTLGLSLGTFASALVIGDGHSLGGLILCACLILTLVSFQSLFSKEFIC